MPVIPADMRFAHWGGSRPGSFRPNGKVEFVGDRSVFDHTRSNPIKATKVKRRPVASVRFFIGFAVGGTTKWKMTDVRRIVKSVRIRQMGAPDATFVAQTGMYSYREEGKHRDTIVTEPGAQVVIINVAKWDVSEDDFRDQMQELGEEICRKLKQELVLAEWQINGVVEESWEVTP